MVVFAQAQQEPRPACITSEALPGCSEVAAGCTTDVPHVQLAQRLCDQPYIHTYTQGARSGARPLIGT